MENVSCRAARSVGSKDDEPILEHRGAGLEGAGVGRHQLVETSPDVGPGRARRGGPPRAGRPTGGRRRRPGSSRWRTRRWRPARTAARRTAGGESAGRTGRWPGWPDGRPWSRPACRRAAEPWPVAGCREGADIGSRGGIGRVLRRARSSVRATSPGCSSNGRQASMVRMAHSDRVTALAVSRPPASRSAARWRRSRAGRRPGAAPPDEPGRAGRDCSQAGPRWPSNGPAGGRSPS